MTMRTLFLFNRLLNTVFKHGIHIQAVLIMLKTLLITVFRKIHFNTGRGKRMAIHPPANIIRSYLPGNIQAVYPGKGIKPKGEL